MQKTGHKYITILVFLFSSFYGNQLLSQNLIDSTVFTWKLLEVNDPSVETKIQFRPFLPAGSTLVSWDFGDSSPISNETNPIHSFAIDPADTMHTVTLVYNNGTNQTISKDIPTNSAFFWISLDRELDSLATYKRVFRSGYNIRLNPSPDPDSVSTLARIGNMRYEWSINNLIVDEFQINNTHGHYPNVYHSFTEGGIYKISLRVYNTNTPGADMNYFRYLNVQPDFTTKEKFPDLPNVFTPNSDGVNDFFEVSTSGANLIKLMVFTRSGQLVYQNEANIVKWDGKNQNGNELAEGIYYYILEDLNKQYETAKGFFYIFRGK